MFVARYDKELLNIFKYILFIRKEKEIEHFNRYTVYTRMSCIGWIKEEEKVSFYFVGLVVFLFHLHKKCPLTFIRKSLIKQGMLNYYFK